MEREILFRGKRVDNGECVYGHFCEFPCDDGKDIPSILRIEDKENERIIMQHPIISETVGRFTGLTDRNGVRIFEGDILQRNNNPKDIVQVVFGKFPVIDMETESEVDEVIGWYCDVIPTDALSRTRPFCLPMPLTDYYINRCNSEVIGNIHDNPEMLKGEE